MVPFKGFRRTMQGYDADGFDFILGLVLYISHGITYFIFLTISDKKMSKS